MAEDVLAQGSSGARDDLDLESDDQLKRFSMRVPAVLVVASLAIGYGGQGGFYAEVQVAMAGLLFLACVVAWIEAECRVGDLVAALGWSGVAVCGWVVLSSVLHGSLSNAIGAVGLVVGTAAVSALARSLTSRDRDQLVVAVITLGCVVALTGWIGLVGDLAPWVHDQGVRRAATSLTYPNAAAGLLSPLALMAVARAGSGGGRLAHGAVCVLLVGLIGTLSRGGTLAFVIGLAVLGFISGGRALLRGIAPGLAGAALAAGGLWSTFVAAPESPWRALAALAAGVVASITIAGRSGPTLMAAVGGTLAGLLIVVSLGHAECLVDGGRWSLAAPERHTSITAALDVGARHPLFGVGPGRALLTWQDQRGETLVSRFAHNEYAQTFAELGAGGLLLILMFVGSRVRAVWNTMATASLPYISAGALAGVAAFGVHSLSDFLWRLPALPLTLAVFVGAGLSPTTPSSLDHEGNKGNDLQSEVA